MENLSEHYDALDLPEDLRDELVRLCKGTRGCPIDAVSLLRDIDVHLPTIFVELTPLGSRTRLTTRIHYSPGISLRRRWAGTALLHLLAEDSEQAVVDAKMPSCLFYTASQGGRDRLKREIQRRRDFAAKMRKRWATVVATVILHGDEVIRCDGSAEAEGSYTEKIHLADAHTPERWQYGIWIDRVMTYSNITKEDIEARVAKRACAYVMAKSYENIATAASECGLRWAVRQGAEQYLQTLGTIAPRHGAPSTPEYCRFLAAYCCKIIRTHVTVGALYMTVLPRMNPDEQDYASVDAFLAASIATAARPSRRILLT